MQAMDKPRGCYQRQMGSAGLGLGQGSPEERSKGIVPVRLCLQAVHDVVKLQCMQHFCRLPANQPCHVC